MSTVSATLKRLHFELGSKAPLIVFADADPVLVVEKATLADALNSGQDRTAATRVYVSRPIRSAESRAEIRSMRA